MEDLLKFIPVLAIILIGIYNEVKKSKAKKAETNRPQRPMPHTREVLTPEAVPMPESWGHQTLDELFRPKPATVPVAEPIRNNKPKTKSKQKEVSVASSLANSVAQDARNFQDSSTHDALAQLGDKEMQDFTISSAEEARRAIIWGEILQRKY